MLGRNRGVYIRIKREWIVSAGMRRLADEGHQCMCVSVLRGSLHPNYSAPWWQKGGECIRERPPSVEQRTQECLLSWALQGLQSVCVMHLYSILQPACKKTPKQRFVREPAVLFISSTGRWCLSSAYSQILGSPAYDTVMVYWWCSWGHAKLRFL